MGAFSLTIGGVDRTAYFRWNKGGKSITGSESLGNRGTLRCVIVDPLSTSSAYTPTPGQTIVLADGATPIFSGRITKIRNLQAGSQSTGTVTEIDASSWAEVLDQIRITLSIAAGGTLRDAFDAILATAAFSGTGITRDAGMAAGPTLAAQVFDRVSAQEAFNHLTSISGWPHRTTAAKVVECFSPGTKTATYSLTASNGLALGPIIWTQQQYEANRILLTAGEAKQVEKTDTWTSVASQTSFPLTYPLASHKGYIAVGANPYVPIGRYGIDSTTWTYDAATNALRRTSAPTVGTVVSIAYTAAFPITVTAEDAGLIASDGLRAKPYSAPEIYERTAADELAAALLRRDKTAPKVIDGLQTRAGPVSPGDVITLTFPDRFITGSHLVQSVAYSDDGDGVLRYVLGCVGGTEIVTTALDYFKGLTAGSSGGSGGTITGSVVPNFSGRFEGEVAANSETPAYLVVLQQMAASDGIVGPAVSLGVGGDTSDLGFHLISDAAGFGGFGAFARLALGPEGIRVSNGWAALLTQSKLGAVADEWWLLPANGGTGKLHIGDTSGGGSGYGSGFRAGQISCSAIDLVGGFTWDGELAFEPQTYTYAAGNFTGSGSMTWGVDNADQNLKYSINRGVLILWVYIINTDVAGTASNELRIALPGGVLAAGGSCGIISIRDAGAQAVGFAECGAGNGYVSLYKPGAANWTLTAGDNTDVRGVLLIPLQ